MNYSKNHYLFPLNKINDFVWESFDEVFSCFFVFCRMDIRISFYKVIPASTCKRKSYPNPVLLSSYQEKASFKSCSASGLTMTLYFIVCPQSFYTHPPTESLIQGFGDTSPIVHQLFFSPLRLVQQKLLLHLLYPKYPLPIEFFPI